MSAICASQTCWNDGREQERQLNALRQAKLFGSNGACGKQRGFAANPHKAAAPCDLRRATVAFFDGSCQLNRPRNVQWDRYKRWSAVMTVQPSSTGMGRRVIAGRQTCSSARPDQQPQTGRGLSAGMIFATCQRGIQAGGNQGPPGEQQRLVHPTSTTSRTFFSKPVRWTADSSCNQRRNRRQASGRSRWAEAALNLLTSRPPRPSSAKPTERSAMSPVAT